MAEMLGDPAGSNLTKLDYTRWRATRSKDGISPKTLNNELGYLSSMFNVLIKAEEIHYPNPLVNIDNVKVPENELAFLTHDQIDELLDETKKCDNPHVYLITKISLSTGARWSETEGLTEQRVRNKKVHFTDTKNGKNRSVPITEELYNEIKEYAKATKRSQIFTASISSFRRALKRTTIDLTFNKSQRPSRPRIASHIRQSFYDEWRKYTDFTKGVRPQ